MMELSIQDLKKGLKKHEPFILGVPPLYSVAATLLHRKGELHVLFEERSKSLSSQPGEVSFPGGQKHSF